MLVQAAGLTIHALDRVDLQRFIHAREIAGRAFGAWRTALLSPPDRRAQMLGDLDLPEGLVVDSMRSLWCAPARPLRRRM